QAITYPWSGAGLVSGGDQATATWNQSGAKTVLVPFTENGCTNTCSTNVDVNLSKPPCAITPASSSINKGDCVDLHGPDQDAEGFAYLWSTGETTQSIHVCPTTTTTYTLTTKRGTGSDPGCQNSCTAIVKVITPGKCWLTGGGQSYDHAGHLHSYGGVINPGCSPTAAGGGNWNDLDHTNEYHFKGQLITVVQCGNVPGIPPGSSSPKTDFNYILFKGTGEMFPPGSNKGTPVTFFGFYEDRHEPASAGQPNPDLHDRYFLQVNNSKTGALVEIIDKNNTPFTFAQVQDPSGLSVV